MGVSDASLQKRGAPPGAPPGRPSASGDHDAWGTRSKRRVLTVGRDFRRQLFLDAAQKPKLAAPTKGHFNTWLPADPDKWDLLHKEFRMVDGVPMKLPASLSEPCKLANFCVRDAESIAILHMAKRFSNLIVSFCRRDEVDAAKVVIELQVITPGPLVVPAQCVLWHLAWLKRKPWLLLMVKLERCAPEPFRGSTAGEAREPVDDPNSNTFYVRVLCEVKLGKRIAVVRHHVEALREVLESGNAVRLRRGKLAPLGRHMLWWKTDTVRVELEPHAFEPWMGTQVHKDLMGRRWFRGCHPEYRPSPLPRQGEGGGGGRGGGGRGGGGGGGRGGGRRRSQQSGASQEGENEGDGEDEPLRDDEEEEKEELLCFRLSQPELFFSKHN